MELDIFLRHGVFGSIARRHLTRTGPNQTCYELILPSGTVSALPPPIQKIRKAACTGGPLSELTIASHSQPLSIVTRIADKHGWGWIVRYMPIPKIITVFIE
jgi:hypothetical protein